MTRAATNTSAATRGISAADVVDPGNEYLSQVPKRWAVSRFGNEMTINGGQVDPRDEPWADMVLVAPNHIESGSGRLIGRETAREQGADSGKYMVRAGQVLYSKIRPALNKVTVAAEDCLCSADMYAMSSSGGQNHRYCMYFMLARPFHNFVSMISDRVKMPKINRSELARAPWLVPPLEEQNAIVAYLDDQSAKIDLLVAKQELLVETLRERRSALAESVLGVLVGTGKRVKWLVRAADERAGEAWAQLPLLSVSITWGVKLRSDVANDQPRAEDMSSYKAVRPGQIVVNRMRAFQGAVGVSSHVGITSPDYLVLTPDDGVDPGWLVAVMRTPSFVAAMSERLKGIGNTESGAVRTPRINLVDLLAIELQVPSPAEQTQQAGRLSEQTSNIDRLIAKAEQFIELAKERRSALITATVTGQIDVREAA